MCGLAGIYNLVKDKAPDIGLLKCMAESLNHRGPDSKGTYVDENIGLAHARLSIIDLSDDGIQPIHNKSKTTWIVFNGEIYNYIELRNNLQSKGYEFYTKTDTEVIVHLYDEYGESFVDYLNGQFAIAIWDKLKQKLVLARDRVGIAPLYYTIYNNKLFFGSEIKSILSVLPERKNLDLHVLDQVFTFWSPISPNTVFKDIYEVSPGQIIVIQNEKIIKRIYWDWDYPSEDDYNKNNVNSIIDELRELLIDATRIRLRADVPVAAYLSGGLDSSVLVSIIKNYTNTPLRTFSIEFDDINLDESKYQTELREYLGTQHSSIKCGGSLISNNFIKTIWHTEQPILRTAPVPMSLLSGLVHRSSYKVVLTGEGSDEVFGGYDIFKEAKIRQFWARNPKSNFRALLLKKLYPYLDVSPGKAQSYLENFFGQGLLTPGLNHFSHMPRWDTTSKIKAFYSSDSISYIKEDPVKVFEKSLPNDFSSMHPFNKAQYIECKTLLPGYLLSSQGDRMLMMNSVEGRFPFLDHRVIEFAGKIHPKYKMKGLNEKYILKRAMSDLVPESILKRYKQPYRAPDIPSFIGNNHKDYVSDLMSSEKISKYNIFDKNKVSLLMKKINSGKAIGYKDNMAFMGILSTQCLNELFINSTSYKINC